MDSSAGLAHSVTSQGFSPSLFSTLVASSGFTGYSHDSTDFYLGGSFLIGYYLTGSSAGLTVSTGFYSLGG